MNTRRSTRLTKITEVSSGSEVSKPESSSSNYSDTNSDRDTSIALRTRITSKTAKSNKSAKHTIASSTKRTYTKRSAKQSTKQSAKQSAKRSIRSSAKQSAKLVAASVKRSSSSEKVFTPPTPDITLGMIEKKPWLSDEFLETVLRELTPSGIISKENPKMLSLVGPMAAGKSTVKKQLDFNDAINLDVDEIKIIAMREFGSSAAGIFADYPKIIQILGSKIIDSKYDFILDTTGKMKEPIKYVMKQAKQAGYTIDIAIVYSTKDLCKKRAQHRNITYTARQPVPMKAVESVYDEFTTSKRTKSYILGIKDIVDMTDNLYLFDNSRCTPEAALIMERHGQTINVHEDFPDFYGVSISQLSPKIVANGVLKTKKYYKNKKIHRKTKRH